jgi:hypothetical protein
VFGATSVLCAARGIDRLRTLTWSRAAARRAFGGHDGENPFTNACGSAAARLQRGIAPGQGGCHTLELSLQLQADRPDVARVMGLRVIEHRRPHAGVAADRDIRMFGIETSRYLEGPLAGAPAGRPVDVRPLRQIPGEDQRARDDRADRDPRVRSDG